MENNLPAFEEYHSEDSEELSLGFDTTSDTHENNHYEIHSSSFKDLLLRPELLRVVAECGFEHPSSVQHNCIPQANVGVDIICQAKSGMGKTAVFVISALQQIDLQALGKKKKKKKNSSVRCLVLCHTREMARQVTQEFERFQKYMPKVRTTMLVGGTPIGKDKENLRRSTHIVVGTPGRTLQLVEERALDLSGLKQFVIDEFDQMLDQLSMRRTVQRIFQTTPTNKQVMMFSATMSDGAYALCKRFTNNPATIRIGAGAKLTLHNLEQEYIELLEEEKNRWLTNILDAVQFNQVIIFTSTTERARALNRLLNAENFPSICTYGKMSTKERIERYEKFRSFGSRLLVVTDLFGRGVDFANVNFVINYDMPRDPDAYLHRVGRAGRFGTKGHALSFVSCTSDKEALKEVCNKLSVDIPAANTKDISTII